jgi:hypothetical protein
MSDDETTRQKQLRRSVASRLGSGVLPRDAGQRILGGRGDDKTVCACCDGNIGSSDILYELQPAFKEWRTARPISMHLRCYRVWIEESRAERITHRVTPESYNPSA